MPIGVSTLAVPIEVPMFALPIGVPKLAVPIGVPMFAVPIGVPMEVRATSFNMSAIRVEWQAVPDKREAIKGILLGYRVSTQHS